MCRFYGQVWSLLDTELLYHASPPYDILNLLRMDATGTLCCFSFSLYLPLFFYFCFVTKKFVYQKYIYLM